METDTLTSKSTSHEEALTSLSRIEEEMEGLEVNRLFLNDTEETEGETVQEGKEG